MRNEKKEKLSMFKKFGSAVVKENGEMIGKMPEADFDYFSNKISCLFRLTPKTSVENPRQFTPYENLLVQLFSGYNEIDTSIRNLHNALIYIRRFPFSKTRIERGDYLRYHYENYLNELYILQMRMQRYLKIISRLYRLDPRGPHIAGIMEKISDDFKEKLMRLIEARGVHVHRERYSDLEFSQLNLFEGLRGEKIPGLNISLCDFIYRKILNVKRDFIKRTNKMLEKFLDKNFKCLYGLLFDIDEHLIIPQNISSKITRSNKISTITVADRFNKLKTELEKSGLI